MKVVAIFSTGTALVLRAPCTSQPYRVSFARGNTYDISRRQAALLVSVLRDPTLDALPVGLADAGIARA